MKVEVKQAKEPFGEGEHEGVIIESEVRDYGKYQYIDYYIEKGENRIKIGYPLDVVAKEGDPRSKLAKLLHRFGVSLEDAEVDPEVIIGESVKFYVTTEKGSDGNEYPVVLEQSLKPKSDDEEKSGVKK